MRWLLAFSLASCAKVADSDFAAPLVSVLVEQDGVTVVAPEYRMHFRSGNFDTPELHMPDSLLVNGTEMFASEDGCGHEGNAGIALFPRFSTNTLPDLDDPSPVTVLEGSINLFGGGPLIGKINVHYRLGYSCNGVQKEMAGDSNFTFFPHGKITRHDSVNPVTVGSIMNAMGCTCAEQPANYFYTSFWSFADSAANPAVSTDADNNVLAGPTADGPFPAGSCTSYAGQRGIAVKFSDGVDRNGATRVLSHTGVHSHVFDILEPPAPMIQSRPENMPDQIFSAIQIVSSPTVPPCSTLVGALTEVTLRVNDDETFAAANEDGIYDLGFHEGSFDITAVDPAPPDTAVIVQMPSGNFEVSQEPATAHPPLVQREGTDSNRFIILFPDGIGPGSTVNVEPK